MRILLVKDVSGLGRAGDIKEVSDGHARNFLMPRGLGLAATQSVVAANQKESREKQDKLRREDEKFKELVKKLSRITLTITGKAGKEHLFAAVKTADISQALKQQQDIEIEPGQIQIKTPIKNLGPARVEIRLNSQHHAAINLDVKAQ